MTIGQQIRQARAKAGLTDDEQLARRLGVSVATLRAWEAEVEAPTDEQFERFAELAHLDEGALPRLAEARVPKGICSPVDLVPDSGQAETLEQVGLPPELWRDPHRWVAFLRLAAAATDLAADEISRLAVRAESCVVEDR